MNFFTVFEGFGVLYNIRIDAEKMRELYGSHGERTRTNERTMKDFLRPVSLRGYSSIPEEEEVLLPPGCTFRVIGSPVHRHLRFYEVTLELWKLPES
ncbi:unnamed protein product [Amoebophrya sp. A25]|nr:unnamed protein product [Amoebophrya sp. A25]|eukprot:GSA25T00020999001.1